MSIAALLIGLALLVLTIPFVVGPIINEKRERKFLTDEPDDEEAETHYQQILVALRDLDFDRQLDVVSDEDYGLLRAQLLSEAAQARTTAGLDKVENDQLDVQIEAAILARRHSPVATAVSTASVLCTHCDEEIDPGDKFCPLCGLQTAAFCPQCDRRLDPDDKFCAGCGLSLNAAVPQEVGV